MKTFRFLLTIARGSAMKLSARALGNSENKSNHTQHLATIPLSPRWRRRFRAGGRAYAGSLFLLLTIVATFLWAQLHREAKSAQPGPGPTIQVSGGLKPGYVNHTFPDPELLFTWTKQIGISGAGWPEDTPVEILIRGPLNSPGVEPTKRQIGSIDPEFGSISGSVTIPYDDGGASRIPRPGLYEVIGHQPRSSVGGIGAIAADRINICPATSIVQLYRFDNRFHFDFTPAISEGEVIDWGHERGGRDGLLGERSPERVDPAWISVWDERPVEVYGTVEPTGSDLGLVSDPGLEGNNQPAFVTYEDWPGNHFGHDVNIMLVPDKEYQWVLGTANFYADIKHPDFRENGRLEIEWEALNRLQRRRVNDEEIHYEDGIGGLPGFAMPTVGDRVYTVGRWILDCGHPEKGLRTEIHPPRLIATMRKHYTTIDLTIDDQQVPTRASQVDIYVSGHGGGANMFLDDLSKALGSGGRIRDIPAPPDPLVYYAPGPLDPQIRESIGFDCDKFKLEHACSDSDLDSGVQTDACLIRRFACAAQDDFSFLKGPAGPQALGVATRGRPETRLVNDMDYEFIVPLPSRPPGANALVWKTETQAQHTTEVKENIELIAPDPTTGKERARVRLKYQGADPSIPGGGIYARTLKLAWNTYSPPPSNHLRVTMTSIDVRHSGDGSKPGEWQIWADVAGHWFYLPGLNPAFLHAGKNKLLSVGATVDVYLEDGEPLRVFTSGYDADDFEDFFGESFDWPLNSRYPPSQYYLAATLIDLTLRSGGFFGIGNNQDDFLGGALFEGQVTTASPIFAPSARVLDDNSYFPEQGKGTSYYSTLSFAFPIATVQPPPLRDITSTEGVTITRSGFVRTDPNNRLYGFGHFAQRVTVHNGTRKPIQGPVYLVLTGLTPETQTLVNRTDFTKNLPPLDRPFVVLNIGIENILRDGQSVSLNLEFTTPLRAGIIYTIQALAGNGLPP